MSKHLEIMNEEVSIIHNSNEWKKAIINKTWYICLIKLYNKKNI